MDGVRARWWENECQQIEELERMRRPDLVYVKVKDLSQKVNWREEFVVDLKENGGRSGLPEDRTRFIEQNRIVNYLLFSALSQYYTKLINENCLNQRKLFGIVRKLLLRNPAPLYPSCSSVAEVGK